jgi:hypothetical protein
MVKPKCCVDTVGIGIFREASQQSTSHDGGGDRSDFERGIDPVTTAGSSGKERKAGASKGMFVDVGEMKPRKLICGFLKYLCPKSGKEKPFEFSWLGR